MDGVGENLSKFDYGRWSLGIEVMEENLELSQSLNRVVVLLMMNKMELDISVHGVLG